MMGGVAGDALRETLAYYDVEGGTRFATATAEGGGRGGRGNCCLDCDNKGDRGAAGAPPSSVLPPWSVK